MILSQHSFFAYVLNGWPLGFHPPDVRCQSGNVVGLIVHIVCFS